METLAVIKALIDQNIQTLYIKLLSNIYNNSTSTVNFSCGTNPIKINRGVRQGDSISPKLFTATLENVFKNLNWEGKGVNIDGKMFNHLRFADDIVVIARNENELKLMLE